MAGSDLLLIFLLQAARPDVCRERKTVKHESDAGALGVFFLPRKAPSREAWAEEVKAVKPDQEE